MTRYVDQSVGPSPSTFLRRFTLFQIILSNFTFWLFVLATARDLEVLALFYNLGNLGMSHMQGHPPELSDSVKLLLSYANRYRFKIDQVLKSIDWHFLYQSFSHFGQAVCLLYKFEVTRVFSHLTDFPSKIRNSACFHFHFFRNTHAIETRLISNER